MFSIVAVTYQGTHSDEILLRGINSLAAQTFRDFEVLLYHDGPMHRGYPSFPVLPRMKINYTAERHNDWGHSLRDRGIREAGGRYIIHFNCDNVLYPRALEVIVMQTSGDPPVITFPILMFGAPFEGPSGPGWFGGRDITHGHIDLMQVVVRRDVWLKEGGWHDRSKESDGIILPKLAAKYGFRCTDTDPNLPLGEHR